MPAYRFNVVPVAAPRMTHADRWKRRPCVVKYFEYRDQVRNQAQAMGVTLSERFSVQFYLPMPRSWSKRKRQDHDGKPHQVKPDADNLAKGFFDCFGEDKHVWSVQITKTWHDIGRITVTLPYDEYCLNPDIEYEDSDDSDWWKRSKARREQAKEKQRLLAKVKSRLAQEQYKHEWAWREQQEQHQDRWRPADERRGTWRPDFED